MTAAHDFELLPHAAVPAEVVDAAEHGQVVNLTRNGEPVAALVPADIAVAGAATFEARLTPARPQAGEKRQKKDQKQQTRG